MKKSPLLNSEISYAIAKTGHTQTICIGDCGLPVLDGPTRIDLALTAGIPTFLQVLDGVLTELCVEKITLAQEIQEKNPSMHKEILSRFPGISVEYVPHEEFKALSAQSRAVIRSGECSPYSNILLTSGVVF